MLGHWVSDGEEVASFWLSVVTDLKNRGVENLFIACVDSLTGFSEAIRSVFPQVEIQPVSSTKSATASSMWCGRIAKPLPRT